MQVYLDYAATTPLHPKALEAMLPYFTNKFGNPSSIHSWGQEAREAVENSRKLVANLLNCEPSEIFFSGTTTTSTNIAIQGIARQYKSKGNHLITTPIEHHAVLGVFYQLADKDGFDLALLPVDEFGLINPEQIEQMVKPETLLISIMFGNNEVGTLQPIEKIGQQIRKINQKREKSGLPRIFFHVDGATVAEYLKLDMKKYGVDAFSLGSHKFHGPKGSGILYIKKGVHLSPILYGGHHEMGLCPGTENVAGIVGTAKALEIAQDEAYSAAKNVGDLSRCFIKEALKIPKAKLTGHPTNRLPDIASFTFEGAEGEAILLHLNGAGIAASSGSACTSGELRASHVLLAMRIPDAIAHSSVRFSLGKETTREEIEYVLGYLPKIIEKLRSISPYGSDVSEKVAG